MKQKYRLQSEFCSELNQNTPSVIPLMSVYLRTECVPIYKSVYKQILMNFQAALSFYQFWSRINSPLIALGGP